MRAVLIRQQMHSRSPGVAHALTAAGVATLLTLALLALSAPPAHALSPGRPASIADRIAVAWMAQQQKSGAFKDPGSKRDTGGYANVMLGYSLLRAGERRHDERLVKAGLAAVTSGLYEPARFRGVFDELAVAASYNFARRRLARDPAFVHARPAWERYIRGVGEPHTQGVLQACMVNPKCFHNHEAAEDLADLHLLGTGLTSVVPGAKLSDRALLKRTVTAKIAGDLAESPGTSGTASWTGLGRPLGMLSDTGQWANAYHALSTAMLGGIVESLGANASAQTRTALRTTTDTLNAFMAPDGDVTYLGRRQEQSWALAATAYAGEVAAGQLHDPKAAERYVGMADSAVQRIERVHLHGRFVLAPVPRSIDTITGYPDGLDANLTVSSGLTAFLLNLTSDAAARAPRVHPAELPASRDGSFLQPDQAGFATVRHGDLWFAVHRRPITTDPRFDFGLIQAKLRRKDGGWRDLLRPRPLTHSKTVNSAGPVLVKHSRRWVPWGESIAVRPGGIVEVHGGWRYLRGANVGAWLRKGVTFRFTPLKDGVALTFPVRSGDNVRMQTYLPASSVRRGPNWVGDDQSTASLSTKPNGIRIGRGRLASCCDAHLSAATMVVHAASDGDLTYSVVAGAKPGGPHAAPIETRVPSRSHDGGGFPFVTAALLLAGALLLTAGFLRHRARVRRRERRRAERLERRRTAGHL